MCFRDSHEYLYFYAKLCRHVHICVCVSVICIFPGEEPIVFIKFSKASLTQKRFRRFRSTALKGALISVKLAKFIIKWVRAIRV